MRNAVSTWCRVRLAGVVFLALVLTGLAAPVKSGKDETVPAVGARFRLLRDAVARPLPAVQGARARRNDTGEEIDLCKARDAWFHDQCVGYWSAPGAKIYAGRPALVAPTELPVLQEGYVIRGDYDAWRAQAGLPEPPDADAVREWAHAFADADPDGEPRPLKELPATTVQQFRFQPAADGTVRDGYWVVNRRDPAQRLFLLYVLEPGAEVERSRKICLQLAQTVTFSPVADTTVARQRKAAWGVKKPEGSPEYAAERAKVIQNIRSLKDWWYVETENYILVANLKERATVDELQKTLETARQAIAFVYPLLQPLTAVSVVRVFNSREGYLDYVGKEQAWSGGLWDSRRDELIISPVDFPGSGDRRDQLLRTTCHEGFHQYLYYAARRATAAAWFNEGNAALFEDLVRKGRGGGAPEIAPDARKFELARTLLTADRFSTRKFVAMGYPAFVAGGREQIIDHYVSAWALMYFLLKGAPAIKGMDAYAAIPATYYRTLVRTGDPAQANAAAWDGVDMDHFDADFRKFWKSKTLVSRAGHHDLEPVVQPALAAEPSP